MHVKPQEILGREQEWSALDRFTQSHERLALLYGPRRVGKSFLLRAFAQASGGLHYQVTRSTPTVQVSDFVRVLGDHLGEGPLAAEDWSEVFAQLARVEMAFLAIDELPYLTEASPELPSLLQRYVDAGAGPPLILAGSALATMTELVVDKAPLHGRASEVMVPKPFGGRDLARLWNTEDAGEALEIDAVVGGLPGYRPMLGAPAGNFDEWMRSEVLAASSPLLEAAEASLAEVTTSSGRAGAMAILSAIAEGGRTFSAISRGAGLAITALSRPLRVLETAGVVSRVPDPLRARRPRYELSDPHLAAWLSLILPNRSDLQAGRADAVWDNLAENTWPSQVLGPRWESVARAHLAEMAGGPIAEFDAVGSTTVADRSKGTSHELDIVAVAGSSVVAIGEAKLRSLGSDDLARLERTRHLLGAPEAALVLASATRVEVPDRHDVVKIGPADIYG